MKTSLELQLRLDDLLAELQHARRNDELGSLALLIYCEVRCWARQTDKADLAESCGAMFTEQPYASREAFLTQVDWLIAKLEELSQKYYAPLVGQASMVLNAGLHDRHSTGARRSWNG